MNKMDIGMVESRVLRAYLLLIYTILASQIIWHATSVVLHMVPSDGKCYWIR
jgi:hypothetical protein